MIGAVALQKDSHIVDIGGGASTLVDELVARGFARITVVDISEAALRVARERVGGGAVGVRWLAADARELTLPEPVDLWHDRAVFHFLTEVADQEAYLQCLRRALAPGGHVVMATFSLSGPQKCSGLPVVRYDADKLARRLGTDFELLRGIQKPHVTPAGGTQDFTYGLFRRSQ